jgi:hypothetical protein
MRNFQAAVNVDLLLSVWNPNRFHLVLNRIDCRILYGQDIVGTGSQYNVSFRAGRINDFILTVDFAPSVVSAAHMLADHLKGSLMLDVLFDIDTSILVSDFASPLYRVNTSYVYESIDAEGQAEIEEERKYCKCVDPDNKPSSPKSLAAVFSPTSPATAGAAAPSTKIGRRFTENPLRRPKVRARVQFAPVGGGRRDAVSLPALRIDTSQQP